MFDRREAILAQIEVTLGSLPTDVAPFAEIFRNRGDLSEARRPAVALLDGTENVVLRYASSRGIKMAPILVELRPQIFALLKARSLDSVVEYGPELSAYRMAILSALFSDTTLHGLLGQNGKLEYLGLQTDMQSHSTMQGELHMNFALTYPLHIGDLS